MLFNDPKLIFVHISKTGGSSITTFLNDYRSKGELRDRDDRFNNHISLQYIHDQGVDLREYTILTSLRSPWERITSFYLMCHRGGGVFVFPADWSDEIKSYKKYVTFPEFYNLISPNHRFNEDYFYYLEVDGKVPEHVQTINFNNIVEETTEFCKSFGLSDSLEKFPHYKENKDVRRLREYLLYDPKFIEVIGEKYKREIEYFGFKPPSLSDLRRQHAI